jgi:glutathione S-transferase
MSIRLYSWPRSSGTRISWALEELVLPYEYVALDAKGGEHRAANHLARHPTGKVPALVDGDQTWFESGAILLHLGDSYGVERGLWPAAGGQPRADATCWTVWAMADLGNYLMQYLYQGLDTPFSYKPEDRSRATAEYNRGQLERCLDAVETRLDRRAHLMGEAFTLVDVACASWLLMGTRLGVSVGGRGRLSTWHDRCAARPAFGRAR